MAVLEVIYMRFNKVLISMFVLIAILVPTCFAQTVSLAYKTGSLNLRQGPSTDFVSLGVLKHGDHITVEEYGSVWSRVRTDDGLVGYIKNLYINDGDMDFAAGTTYVSGYTVYTTANVNFRSGASTGTKSMGVLKKGTKLTVLGKNDGFCLVERSDGTQGYVSLKYVSRNKPSGSSSKSSSSSSSVIMTKYVTAKAVNMRERGTINSKVLKVLPYGAKVSVLKLGNYWDKVSYKGYVGWIKKCYLKKG
jgi:mannosyl-glycoprotein endo-beta-N-acetylglucosaminidase